MNDLDKRKYEKLVNADLNVSIVENNDNQLIIDIYVSENIEPYVRHRDRRGRGGKYDPLAKYKTYLGNNVKQQLESLGITEPLEGELSLYVKYYKPFNKDHSQVFRLMALAHEIRPTVKPDSDNILKTIQDAFNEKVFNDDIQINTVKLEKFYYNEPKTYIRLIQNKINNTNRNNCKGKRLNKSLQEDYENKIKNIKLGF